MAEAPDDLIAELAKLMAQDNKAATPSKPAAPVFTVRIPGEQPPRSSSHDATWIPQPQAPQSDSPAKPTPAPAAAPQPVPQQSQPARPIVAPTPVETPVQPAPPPVQQPVPRSFESAPRVDAPVQSAPKPQASQPIVVPPTAAPRIPVAPVEAPDYAGNDSIADLIAAELAIDPQPAMRPLSPAPRQEPPMRSEPSFGVSHSTPERSVDAPETASSAPAASAPPVDRSPSGRSEPAMAAIPPIPNLGSPQGRFNEQNRAPEPRREPAMPRQATVDPSFARVTEPRPVAPQPDLRDERIGQDPVDEIENMIGRAMRVNLDEPREPTPQAARPAQRSLATPSLPKQSAPQRRSSSAADETILAAAQASGAQLDWADAPEPAQAPRKPKRQPRERRERPVREPRSGGLSRAVAGPLVALTLLLAAGFGLYWVLGMGGKDDGPAPLLTADATPTKEVPAADPTAETDQQSVVFNEIDGVQPGANEQLVSRDQADVNEVAQVAAAPEVSQEGLANRKVRTLTVRPDGTIVRGDDSLAGSTILPVDRPEVPAVPGAETASDELLASVPAQAATPSATTATSTTTTTPAVEPEPVAATVPIVAPGATVPAVDTAGNAIAGLTTVIPLQRPAQFAQQATASAAPTDTTVATQAEATPATTASTSIPGATEVEALGNTAPAYVQLASQRTEAEARTTAQALVTRYGPLFGGANMEVQRVDLGTRGVFYRVRVPAGSLAEASNICTNVKAAGGDCFTM